MQSRGRPLAHSNPSNVVAVLSAKRLLMASAVALMRRGARVFLLALDVDNFDISMFLFRETYIYVNYTVYTQPVGGLKASSCSKGC